MNRTSIEWVRNPDGSQGYTHNPMSGCKNHTLEGLCLGGLFPCYAFPLANGRLKPLYLANKNVAPDNDREHWHTAVGDIDIRILDPFYPRFWEERLVELERGIDSPDYQRYIRQKPKGIFVADMGDLFGIGVPESWTARVLDVIGDDSNSMHRFYLLTKQPQNLIKFSPFPDNCWVGVTATNMDMLMDAVNCLEGIKAKVKYISLEPLLAWADTSKWVYPLADSLKGLDWLIIGACTGTVKEMARLIDKYPDLAGVRYGNKWTAQPPIEWVREIVEAATKTHIPIFEKDNLSPLLEADSKLHGLRQEMPE